MGLISDQIISTEQKLEYLNKLMAKIAGYENVIKILVSMKDAGEIDAPEIVILVQTFLSSIGVIVSDQLKHITDNSVIYSLGINTEIQDKLKGLAPVISGIPVISPAPQVFGAAQVVTTALVVKEASDFLNLYNKFTTTLASWETLIN